MMYFVTYKKADGKEECLRFFAVDQFWDWLQQWKNSHDNWPPNLAVYKGECVFDGS